MTYEDAERAKAYTVALCLTRLHQYNEGNFGTALGGSRYTARYLWAAHNIQWIQAYTLRASIYWSTEYKEQLEEVACQ